MKIMLGETTIHKTPSLCESVGKYKIEQYICGKYISKHYKHKTHDFYVENLPNVRRIKPRDRSPLKQFHYQQ